jgi:diketogulonate reductase-like aldo/keto reductase
MSSTSAIQITKSSKYKLNNGKSIPVTGYGVYQVPKDKTAGLVYKALSIGYRHIDTAVAYHNYVEVAEGIAKFLKDHPEVSRRDIWFTTKIQDADHGYDNTRRSVVEMAGSLKDLIGYIDLILVHSPHSNKEKRLGTWKALQEFTVSNDIITVGSIGVSNYGIKHLQELFDWEGFCVMPVINQLELHPWSPQLKLREFLVRKGICIEAYSPLTRGLKFKDPEVVELSQKYNISPVEMLLKWSYLQGFIVLVKSENPERIQENYNVLPDGHNGVNTEIPLQFGKVDLDYEIIDRLNKPDSHEIICWNSVDPTLYEG